VCIIKGDREQYSTVDLACMIWSNTQVILLYHLFAIYNHNRVIVYHVIAAFVVCSGLAWSLALGNIVLAWARSSRPGASTPPEMGICTIPQTKLMTASWIPMMAMDAILMLLITSRIIQHYRSTFDRTWTGASLMKTLGQGAVLCYSCVFLSGVLLVFLSLFTPWMFSSLGPPVLVSLSTISINRLVFWMNKAGRAQGYNSSTSLFTVDSTIRFTSGSSPAYNTRRKRRFTTVVELASGPRSFFCHPFLVLPNVLRPILQYPILHFSERQLFCTLFFDSPHLRCVMLAESVTW